MSIGFNIFCLVDVVSPLDPGLICAQARNWETIDRDWQSYWENASRKPTCQCPNTCYHYYTVRLLGANIWGSSLLSLFDSWDLNKGDLSRKYILCQPSATSSPLAIKFIRNWSNTVPQNHFAFIGNNLLNAEIVIWQGFSTSLIVKATVQLSKDHN